MTKTEFRITVNGPEAASEQLLHELKKLESEGQRQGVTVQVERIETTDVEAEFSKGSEQ